MRRLLLGVVMALLGIAALPAIASAASVLAAGTTLSSGQSIVASAGQYQLTMQSDGNLVESIVGGRLIWQSQTSGNPGAHAIMQTNGNLAVVDSQGAVLWSSNSHASGCASELAIQDDGNLVIYDPNDKAVWSNGAIVANLVDGDVLRPGWARFSASENLELLMQSDGNLVLYSTAGAVWNTGTFGNPGAHAILQTDGNLVVYAPNGSALWNSGTFGNGGDSAWVQTDGNFVVYSSSGEALWQAGTGGRAITGYAGPKPPAAGSCPPPPAPPPPAVTQPVTTPVPSPPSPRALAVKLSISWTWDRATTRIVRVKAGHFPGATRLLVACAGKGCPRHSRRSARGHRGVHRLLRALRGRQFHAGDRLFITLSAPGYLAERAEVTFRWGRMPRVRLL